MSDRSVFPASWPRCAVLGIALTGACGTGRENDHGDSTVAVQTVASAGASIGADERELSLDTVATGLEVPWAIDFTPDGRLFVTERAGRVRVVERGALRPEPWVTLAVAAGDGGEGGLMGIAVAPDFATTGAIYVLGTFASSGGLTNRVMRLVDRGGHGVEPTVILDGIPASRFHAGGALRFGPDGMLYVGTGDAREPGLAREPGSLGGKILRVQPDGRAPADNPTPSSPVFAMGLRNVQGLAWDPGTHQLFATEHGPSGFPNERFRRDNDELNAIRGGGNYGWPSVAGRGVARGSIPPLTVWTPAIAPSGLAFYAGNDIPDWRMSLFVGALRGEELRRVAVVRDSTAAGGWRVTSEAPLFRSRFGRIRAVALGPDGRIYFSTSNRDGRGSPSRSDDKVFRITSGRRGAGH